MTMDMKTYIGKLASGTPLSRSEAAEAFKIMMSGEATPSQIGGFLMGLRLRGETVEEITGAVETMRAKVLGVTAPDNAIDIVGTGGDGVGTYNISTCTAFVTAACGVPIAKHGNRALSSKSGAADVLIALGVNIDINAEKIGQSIQNVGVGFMFAPAHHAAMKHVGPSRVELGTRTIFNILGPLANPAGTKSQLIGVFSKEWLTPMAEVMRNLGAKHVWVVYGSDGLDEITTTGPTYVTELKNGELSTFEITPEQCGLPLANIDQLKGGDAVENARALEDVLAGAKNAYRDIVVMNAAAALIVADKADDLTHGAQLASQAIDSGAARKVLDQLIAFTNQD